LSVSAEFVCFHGILWNSVLAGDIGDKYGMTFNYHSDSCSAGRNIESIELRLSEILTVYLVGRMCMSVAVTGDKYCIFARVEGL